MTEKIEAPSKTNELPDIELLKRFAVMVFTYEAGFSLNIVKKYLSHYKYEDFSIEDKQRFQNLVNEQEASFKQKAHLRELALKKLTKAERELLGLE